MSARTAIKAFGQKVGNVRYVGRLARISAAVWRMPYTAATLQELKASVNEIASAQQEKLGRDATVMTAPADNGVGVKLEAIADGYGSALSGIEKALRNQEQQIVALRREIETQTSSTRTEAHSRFVLLESEIGKLAELPQQYDELKVSNATLSSELAGITEKMGWISVDNDNIRARLESIRTELLAAVAKLQEGSDSPSLLSLKDQATALNNAVASLTEKTGWISVDNDNIRARLESIRTELMAAVVQMQADQGASTLISLKEQATALNNAVTSIAEKMTWIGVDNDNIRARLEFIRTEVMFELRKQMHLTHASATVDSDPATTPRIVNIDKVNAGGPKRLNLGCGHVPKDDYINVDFRALPGVDVVGDVSALDFAPGTIDAIFAAHLIEHFPVKALRDVVLPHWYSLLRPGGEIVLIAPDGEAMLEAYREGVFSFDELREVLYGGQEYEGDFHFNMLSPKSGQSLLAELGFTSIRINAAGRRNGNCLEFEIYAEKPLS